MKPDQIFSGIARLQQMQEEHEGTAALMDILRPRFDALRTRHQDGTAPRAIAAFNLFQTPEPLAARMADLAELSEGQRLLEPSAGLGRILRACEAVAENLQTLAIESAADCARELFKNWGDLKILQRDFLTVTPEETGLFDRVVMNPPFKMRRDIKHIRHAMEFLQPGGILVALCLATDHRRETFQGIAEHLETIPAGTFRAEGTGVETILLKIRK
jgi:phospholipid N-methyltransferase